VILIEVDGLEPKDVTPQTTPFLWELAHPNSGQMIDDTERAGWTWQAPRAVMSAGTAANAAALLTGSYPEQNGVPADDYVDPSGRTTTVRLEQSPVGEDVEQVDSDAHFRSQSLLTTVPLETGSAKRSAAFVGNPALSGIVNLSDVALKWWPQRPDEEGADQQSPPSPAYCDFPRTVPDDPNYRPPCSAQDMVTLDKAFRSLSEDGDRIAFTYIHLAELGVMKRRDGDFAAAVPAPEPNSPAAQESLPHALAQVDAAVAQFVARYTDSVQSPQTAEKWNDTYFMVVGSHGYETAPYRNRLPAPDGEPDLETYLEAGGQFKYSPYGSMATITSTESDPIARRDAIATIAEKFKPGGDVEQACAEIVGAPAPCIKEVLYTREQVAPPEVLADPEQRAKYLLPERYPSWHFDHVSREEPFGPTGASGELLVITNPEWATAAALPALQTGSPDDPVSDNPDPYLGVAGGPRNRAVAAIINGPNNDNGVRQVVPRRYPVTRDSDIGELRESPEPEYGSVLEANAAPENDTDAQGHERQPENVDFAPTIAALLGIAIDDGQLAGRFLQEAFTRPLAFPDLDAPPPPEPDPVVEEQVVVEPEPEVIIIPPPPVQQPPPPPKPWDYGGLVRKLRAAVGDKKGRVFPNVPPKANLSYLILRADFGKPLSSVKLSFYRQQRSSRSGRTGVRRTVVKTLATFDPFPIKRAKDAKLTLKVPTVFKPTHVGVVVQQARRLTGREADAARRKKAPMFKTYGAKVGGIYRVKNARRLHTIAPKRATRPRRG
jgi:hypothetical protein